MSSLIARRLDEIISAAVDSGGLGLTTRVFRAIAASAAQQGVTLELTPLTAVGTCNYAKLPVVEDLMSAAPLLAEHDLIVALAEGTRDGFNPDGLGSYIPAPPDSVRPNRDFLVLDADSS